MGEKKEKNSKKILSPQLFVFVRCLSRKTNPIKSSSFNLFRVLSLSCSSLSNNNNRFIIKALMVFCSVPQSLLLRFLLLFFSRTTRESEIYITHRRRRLQMSQQQTTMRERFQKAKWEQFCAHFNNNLKVFLNFDENQWTIETKRRKTGHSEGSFDAYYLFCAEEKRGKTKRFRSLKEVERKLREDARETKEKKTSTEKHIIITTTTTTAVRRRRRRTTRKTTTTTEELRKKNWWFNE